MQNNNESDADPKVLILKCRIRFKKIRIHEDNVGWHIIYQDEEQHC